MKRLFGFMIFSLLFSLPTRAQVWSSAYGGGSISGMGAINSMGSINGMGGLGHVIFADLPSGGGDPHYQNSSAHGSASDFVPSTFVPYEQALVRGRAALAPDNKPKPVARVAEEYRAVKRAAAKLAIVQDANGKIVKEVQ